MTDATIGTYTVSAILALLSVLGVSEENTARGWWLTLVVGLVISVPTALTGLAEWLSIERGTPLYRTATSHMLAMVTATVLFLIAALVGHSGYVDAEVNAGGLMLTIAGWLMLTLGGWLGGAVVFVHGMRVLNLVEEPARSRGHAAHRGEGAAPSSGRSDRRLRQALLASLAAMRRLVIVATAVVLVDSTLYAALTPLLPGYADQYDLSKAGAGRARGGVCLRDVRRRPARRARRRALRAAHGRPGRPARRGDGQRGLRPGRRRVDARRGALHAGDRQLARVGGRVLLDRGEHAVARRGQAIGTAMGGAVFGAMLGPAIGAVAGVTSQRATFLAFALVAWGLAMAALRLPDSGRQPIELGALRRAIGQRELLAGLLADDAAGAPLRAR